MGYVSDCDVATDRNVFRIRIKVRGSGRVWAMCNRTVSDKVCGWSARIRNIMATMSNY